MPKYFKKLLLFGMIVAVLPIIFWGAFSYFQSSASLTELFSVQNKQTLYQSQLKVEQILETIDHSVTQYMLSPSFRFADRPLSIPDFVEIRELMDGMLKLQVERLGVEGFALLNNEKDWMITEEGFKKISQSGSADVYERYRRLPDTSTWIVDESGGKKNINLVKKIPILTNISPPKGLLIIKISEAKINQLLMQDVTFGDLYIIDQNHQNVVGHNNDEETTGNLMALFHRREIEPSDNIVTQIKNSNKIVNYRKSNYNNWIYVSVFSADAATNDLKKMAGFTIMFCICTLVLMGVIIVMGTRKIYNPIRKIYELSKHFSNSDEAKDELLSIERHMDTLMKAKTKLNTQLEMQSKYIKDSFVLKMLWGRALSSEWKEEIHAPNSRKWTAVISIQIDTPAVRGYNEKDLYLILFAIENIASELVPPSARIGTVVLDQTQVSILTGQQRTEQEFRRHIHRMANLIKNSVNSYLKMEVSIGIGTIHEGIDYISKSYKESLEALKYRIRLGSNVILHFDDVIDRTSKEFRYPQQLEEQLLHSIKKMYYPESKALLNQMIAEVTGKEISYEEYQFFMLRLLSSITRIIHDQGRSIQDVAGKNVSAEHLFQHHSVDELGEWLYESIIKPIIRFLEKEKNTQSSVNLTEAIIQIIHNEFDSDLSLEYCASKVNFHPSYVSRVFKKDMGISFSEYLANYRLKMSEKWLVETDMNISEMAERFKYNSAAAFIRYFRKMKGMTPGDFRRKHLER